jgi:hypothetical protein
MGITLDWASGPAGESDEDAIRLTAHVLSGGRTSRFLKDSPLLPESVLGVAPDKTSRVYVFWDRIVQRARRGEVRLDRVLGRVLAHEIGHHLLPAQGHSSMGLMRASLDYQTLALPTFTDAQNQSIRTLLVAAN